MLINIHRPALAVVGRRNDNTDWRFCLLLVLDYSFAANLHRPTRRNSSVGRWELAISVLSVAD